MHTNITLKVPHCFHTQDLEIIEDAITEMENIKLRQHGGEYLNYQIGTLLKAWSHLAGSARPDRPPVLKKSAALKKLRPPLKLTGTFAECSMKTLGVRYRGRGRIGYHSTKYFACWKTDLICRCKITCKRTGTALRYGSWDYSERNLLAEYRVRPCCDCMVLLIFLPLSFLTHSVILS